MAKSKTAITPTRAENYSQWYQEVIKESDLAENSVVRGCMVIKPWGNALWENIRNILDQMIKDTGHENFYFPMFIPLSFLEKEAQHVAGFAKECAVITHHRLVQDENNKLVPSGKLEEPLVVRPTSEVLIGEAYSRWIKSYRDLPILGNQWANVVRWEMRPRIFLRTSEFLWQEGHTAHATADEAVIEAEKMLEVYRELIEDYLAIPVILGQKTEAEKFPGADVTYCLEAMMQDGRALQAGTSHFLGQNFAKAFNIKFLSANSNLEHVWTTSWGVTTRLIGGLIMVHSDDNGLILPPKIAPNHVVIIPVIHKQEQAEQILAACTKLKEDLLGQNFAGCKIKVLVDQKDKSSAEKKWQWVKKGVPLIIELGIKELESQNLSIIKRSDFSKHNLSCSDFVNQVSFLLEQIQSEIYSKAKNFMQEKIFRLNNKEEFFAKFTNNDNCFVEAFWIGDAETEKMLKEKFKVTARCIPLVKKELQGKCIFTGQEKAKLTIFARAY